MIDPYRIATLIKIYYSLNKLLVNSLLIEIFIIVWVNRWYCCTDCVCATSTHVARVVIVDVTVLLYCDAIILFDY